MPRGGARSRSGPPPDPKSERSEKLGRRFGKLPRLGYTGRVPAWPLSKASARERQRWKAVWRTPQAAAWSTEPWRHDAVAMFVRCAVRAEEPDAPAAIVTAMLRLRDEIGLTPAGLRLNEWEIEEAPGSRTGEPVEQGAPARPAAPVPTGRVAVKQRLTVVPDAGSA